jgi:hypothetical protein
MFGFVSANVSELTKEQKQRYNSVYCGICRQIRQRASQTARLTLSYDMAFLAMLLMSLYEPEETSGNRACALHPFKPKPWVDNEFVRYAADMNVALSYYKCLDDWNDDKKHTAKFMAGRLENHMSELTARYPRQCGAIESCIARLSALEKDKCGNIDEPANCFGELMGELLVYKQDYWKETLYQVGFSLGRFIYLADAVVDYPKDKRRGKYNPLLQSGREDPARWEEYLVLAMAKCTGHFEKLPLVQDKAVLDNILYSGVWMNFGKQKRKSQEEKDV